MAEAEPVVEIAKTFAAIGTGYLVYMTVPLLLAWRGETGALISDPLVMRRMAIWGDAILLGVWGATLSSAVGSILGAPRVLQALARDGINILNRAFLSNLLHQFLGIKSAFFSDLFPIVPNLQIGNRKMVN